MGGDPDSGYGHTVTRKIAKGFKPSRTEGAEREFFEDVGVEGVSVVDNIFKRCSRTKGDVKEAWRSDSRGLWNQCIHKRMIML